MKLGRKLSARTRLTLFICLVLASCLATISLRFKQEAFPVLAFKEYANGATNGERVAKFELRNTTSKSIWLFRSGSEFPLKPQFLERTLAPPPTSEPTNHVYSLYVGSFFRSGQKVAPGENLLLEFPLSPDEPATQVGLSYYVGRIKDGNDLVDHVLTPLLDTKAGIAEKAKFYWDKAKRRFTNLKRYEIWCPEPVSFQASMSNAPSVQRSH